MIGWNKRHMKWIIAAFLAAFFVAIGLNDCRADGRLHVGYVQPWRTSGVTGHGVATVSYWTEKEKWNIGATYLGDQRIDKWRLDVDDFYYVYAQRCGWYRKDHQFLRVYLCVGIAALPEGEVPPLISLPLTFHLTAGVNIWGPVTLSDRHLSNAGLKRPNSGQDLGVIGLWVDVPF